MTLLTDTPTQETRFCLVYYRRIGCYVHGMKLIKFYGKNHNHFNAVNIRAYYTNELSFLDETNKGKISF